MNTPDFRNYKNAEIDKTIDAAMTSLRTITGNSMDLNIMNVKICSVSCALVSIEGMISTSAMSELIFRPIMELSAQKSKGNSEQVFDFLTKESLLAVFGFCGHICGGAFKGCCLRYPRLRQAVGF